MPFVETPNVFTWDNLADAWADLDFVWVRGLIIDISLGPIATNQTISDDAFSFTISRGRTRDLERTSAGQLSASFRNETRRFDPLNTQSDLDGYILPKRPVNVILDGERIFSGVIDNWDFDYTVGGESSASFTAFDAFAIFTKRPNVLPDLPKQRSGERVSALLNQPTVQWPNTLRDIDKGDTFLEGIDLDGSVLSQLNIVEEGEAGFLFIAKDGSVAFRSRNFNQPATPLRFSDTNNGLPYVAAQIVFGLELFANKAVVENSDDVQVFDNLLSQTEFGVSERSFKTNLSTLVQLRALAKYVVARYGEPELRVEQIDVNLESLTLDDRLDVLGLELGDIVEVEFTPNKIGDPIILRNRIIGLSHSKSLATHTLSVFFENLPFGDFFVLDDAELGTLDNADTGLAF